MISLFNEDSNTKKWFKEKNKSVQEVYAKHKRPYQGKLYKSSTKVKFIQQKFISRKFIQLNYDNISHRSFTKILHNIYHDKELEAFKDMDVIIPIMSIGHVKAVHSFENLQRILDKINSTFKEKIVYWTLRDAIRYWCNEREHVCDAINK
jgi:hypothetical protein